MTISFHYSRIAASSMSLGAILVTNNVREFKLIKGLKVENWV